MVKLILKIQVYLIRNIIFWTVLNVVCAVVRCVEVNAAESNTQSDEKYYVSTQGVDTNPGTEMLPFRTIQQAADIAQAGNTVYIKSGTYSEFSIGRSGAPGNPIIFRSYPGEHPVIEASRSDREGVILLNNKSYIVLEDLTVRGGRIGIEIIGENAANNQVLNCDVSFATGTGIGIYHKAHDNVIRGCKVYNNARGNWPRGAKSWGAGLSTAHGCFNNLFEGNYIYWNHGEGTSAFDACNRIIWRWNVIADNWGVNLYVDGSKDCVIDGNLIYVTPEAKAWSLRDGYTGHNRNNTMGIVISVESYTDFPPSERDVTGTTILNNIIVNTMHGIRSYGPQESGHPFTGWIIANNTLVNNDWGIYLGVKDVRDNIVRNNVVFQASGGYAVRIDYPTGSSSFSSNLYFGSETTKFRWGTSETDFSGWKNLLNDEKSRWINPSLQNTSYIPPRFWSDSSLPPPSDMLPFVNLTENFQLTMDSPAIDAGVVITGFNSDIEGTLRPQGKGWDIGAYEFVV